MSELARLKIYRGTEEKRLPVLEFEVPTQPVATLLDALIDLRDHQNSEVTFDYACITNNSCKLCSVRVNRATAYACTFILAPGATYTVEPIDAHRPHHDLFTHRKDVW
jgi:succinate dehydrogenase/fumarate reductase-like Fe-S protein